MFVFFNGCNKVDLMDCFLMVYCFWSQFGQIDKIWEIVMEFICCYGYIMAVNLQMIKWEIQDFEEDVDWEIWVCYIVIEVQLQLIKDEYYEFVKEDDKFDGVFFSVK